MPYKSERIPLNGLQDRRRKLTDEQKEQIRHIYKTQRIGTRTLAKQFGVSKDLILIIVNPGRAERVKQHIKDHWKDYQKSGEEWNEVQKEHRHYKHELYLKGELKLKEE